MAEVTASESAESSARIGHRIWVRVCHWTGAVGFLALAVSGYFILMVHPRLYWGEVGNDLTPALLELPISNNHRPEGWEQTVTFSDVAGAPFSANRTYAIFNQNGWARSLHFLSGWVLVLAGLVYLVAGLVTGHIRRDLWPRRRDFSPQALWQDLKAHLRLDARSAGGGAPYGRLQRWAYAGVAFVALPFMVLTGFGMSPTISAAYPILSDIFGGHQSARTLHFFGFAALMLFFLVHVAMVISTGFRRQIRAMTLGE